MFEPIQINGISAEWITCHELNDGVVLYLHDGAFALGSINGHREFLARCDAGDPLPSCVVCISPWLDLTLSIQSIQSKARADPVISAVVLASYADDYAGDYEKTHVLISPIFTDLAGISLLLIHVGTDEILLDEATHLSEKAPAAGVDVVIERREVMFHVFQMVPSLPETRLSLNHVAKFISSHIEPRMQL